MMNDHTSQSAQPDLLAIQPDPQKVLVTGAGGQLGHYILRELNRRKIQPVGWSLKSSGTVFGTELEQVDLSDESRIIHALNAFRPTTIIHAGAISGAEDVRQNPDMARRVNTRATQIIARWAGDHDSRLIFTSTDLVFDGTHSFWKEEDTTNPLLEYGRTKADAEPFVAALPRGLVTRISLLYGPTLTGRPSFYTATLEALRQGQSRSLFTDEWRTPLTYAQTADILCRLAIDRPDVQGILHVGGPERITRYELLRRAAAEEGLDLSLVKPALAAETNLAEPRPPDVSLNTTRLRAIFQL